MNSKGFTLVELTVVLVVMSVLLSAVGLSLTNVGGTERGLLAGRLDAARDSAVRYEMRVKVDTNGSVVTFFPDGSAHGQIRESDSLQVDPWTGVVVVIHE